MYYEYATKKNHKCKGDLQIKTVLKRKQRSLVNDKGNKIGVIIERRERAGLVIK